MQFEPYRRTVHYYETDQMGIVHHSNYIRWLEESRMDLMRQIGVDYNEMEDLGIIVPVLGVQCTYRVVTKFNDTVLIIPKIEKVSAVKFVITYRIVDAKTGELHNTAETQHCFLGKDFKPLFLKKDFPDIYKKFKDLEGVTLYEDN